MSFAISPDEQRAIARSVCTEKEYAAWELVELRGLAQRAAADFLGISHSSLKDRLASAKRKITGFSRSEFQPRRKPIQTEDPSAPVRMIIGLLVQRDGPLCYLCRRHVPADKARVEHIIPVSRGGTDDPENLALSCDECNCVKGANYVSVRLTSGAPVYHPEQELPSE